MPLAPRILTMLENAPPSSTVEWRDDELVLSSPSAVDSDRDRDYRVPVNAG